MQNRTLRTIFNTRTQASSGTKEKISLLQGLFTGTGNSTQSFLAEQQGTMGVPENSEAAIFGNSKAQPGLLADFSKNLDRLRTASEAQSTLLGANTQALTSNTAAQSIRSAITSAGSNVAGSLLGNALGSLPIVSTLFKLFGGGTSTPTPAPQKYALPLSQNFEAASPEGNPGTLNPLSYNSSGLPRPAVPADSLPYFSSLIANSVQTSVANNPSRTTYGLNDSTQPAPATNPPAPAPSSTQVTVQVQAMDSRSFMDRSHDIAQAVREAMLNMHSINDVVNDL